MSIFTFVRSYPAKTLSLYKPTGVVPKGKQSVRIFFVDTQSEMPNSHTVCMLGINQCFQYEDIILARAKAGFSRLEERNRLSCHKARSNPNQIWDSLAPLGADHLAAS